MGCAGSTGYTSAAIAEDKAAIASAKVDFKQIWNGLLMLDEMNEGKAGTNVESVLKCVKGPGGNGAGQLQDTNGTVLLDIVPGGNKYTTFNTPDGVTVALIANTLEGDSKRRLMYEAFANRTPMEWVIWTAEDAAQTGQPPVATPAGVSMYKFGSIKMRNERVSFFDSSATKVMTVKNDLAKCDPFKPFTVRLYSADGTTPMAVVEGMWPAVDRSLSWRGEVTFAKGLDPIIALCMAVAGNSFALSLTNCEAQSHNLA